MQERLVAGVDGAKGGWAVVIANKAATEYRAARFPTVSDLLAAVPNLSVITIDIPIGLSDGYAIGGRVCDGRARRRLGRRASSVFPAPVRGTLAAATWEEACALSRASAAGAKGMSKQSFGILSKINEIDDLLQTRPELRSVIYEIHPELCFLEIGGTPMAYRKADQAGRSERRAALQRHFSNLDDAEATARRLGIHSIDFLDACVACWTALRIAQGTAKCDPDP